MKKIISLALVAVILFTMALSGCSLLNGKKEYVVSLESDLISLDPALFSTSDDASIISQMFRGLYKIDSEGHVVTDLADKYTLSEDGLTYTFELVAGTSWSDSKAFTESVVTAEDVVFSWKRAADPATKAPHADMLSNIAGYKEAMDEYNAAGGSAAFDSEKLKISIIEKEVDEKKAKKKKNAVAESSFTFSVTLAEKDENFLEKLTYPIFYPVKKSIVEANADWATKPETCVGNSVYKLKAIQSSPALVESVAITSSFISLVTNKKYDNYDIDSPEITLFFLLNADEDALIKKFYESSSAKTSKKSLLFVSGLSEKGISSWESIVKDAQQKASDAEKAPEKDEKDIEAKKNTAEKLEKEIRTSASLSEFFLKFNTTKEALSNPLVRKALTLAINRAYLCYECDKICTDNETPAEGIIADGFLNINSSKTVRGLSGGYYNSERYDFYLEEAKKCLAEAGYPNGEGLPVIKYVCSNSDTDKLIANEIVKMWAQLGISVNSTLLIEAQDPSTYKTSLSSGSYDIISTSYSFDYNNPVQVLDMFTTGSELNSFGWSNERYDELVKNIHEDLEVILRKRSGRNNEEMANTKNDEIKDAVNATNDAKGRISINVRDAEDILFEEWIVAPIYSYGSQRLVENTLSGPYTSISGIQHFDKIDFTDE